MQLPITQETMPPPDLKKSKLLQKKNQDILYPSENVIIKDNETKSEFSMRFTIKCKTVINNSR